jgi:hypothetical protein
VFHDFLPCQGLIRSIQPHANRTVAGRPMLEWRWVAFHLYSQTNAAGLSGNYDN